MFCRDKILAKIILPDAQNVHIREGFCDSRMKNEPKSVFNYFLYDVSEQNEVCSLFLGQLPVSIYCLSTITCHRIGHKYINLQFFFGRGM